MILLGEEQVSETVITDVYKDPLEFCMEGIEEMARKILRTGKLAITGEPGGECFMATGDLVSYLFIFYWEGRGKRDRVTFHARERRVVSEFLIKQTVI